MNSHPGTGRDEISFGRGADADQVAPRPRATGPWTKAPANEREAATPGVDTPRFPARRAAARAVTAPGVTAPGVTAPAADVSGLAVATVGLVKRFGEQQAVAGIDLAVPRGSVYGFLGPNGSGKTTTIRMLLGLIHPTSGSQRLLDVTMPAGANAVLPRVGSLVEGPAFHPQLSGRANLARLDAADRTASARTAATRVDAALDRVGLLAAATKRYRAYSLGMKQRLAIAAGLLQPRELMILDEPTNGLDPQGTREVRALVREIAADGTTVFVSSHLLAEVEQVCSHVGVMRQGELVFQGTLDELRGRGTPRILVRTSEPDAARQVLARLGLAEVTAAGREVTAQLGGHAPETVCAELVHAGVPVAGLETPRASLEDLFVQLTGEGFDVNG
ncbi:MAG TPA: ABC transporter ATP-binding protein [Streptosporangiaceae bacterium]|nr:ABC transporter ATP-binding protein [Streptosporangiaceae bacterium]